MPLKKCTKNGKSGWKWGDSGACYTGPGARKKAIKQGRAIKVSQGRLYTLLRSIDETLNSPEK